MITQLKGPLKNKLAYALQKIDPDKLEGGGRPLDALEKATQDFMEDVATINQRLWTSKKLLDSMTASGSASG